MRDTDTDTELVAAYQNGHTQALEILYWRHAERVWRYARYFSGSEETAAEIVQETFLRVTKYLAGFEGRAQFSTWLFSIVRSAAVETVAKQHRAGSQVEETYMEQIPITAPEPDQELIASETRAVVRAAIARLPEHEREAVLLCEIGDLPIRTAGEILGWGESRVRVTLFRARRRLKEMLAAYVGAEN
ncbi:MAG: sigma-70 family RNA polymerase sigma factor [Planctomycetota bacterium]